MALIRMTEKKLAANRANARLSKGPITAAGKEKVSRSACKHHLYARKHLLPPEWEDRIWKRILPLVQDIQDPIERQIKTEFAYYGQWSMELDRLWPILLRPHLLACGGDLCQAKGQFGLHDPRFLQLLRRTVWLDRKIGRAQRDLRQYRRFRKLHPAPPATALPLKVMAAAAGCETPVSADQSHISLIPNTRQIPIAPAQHPIAGSAPAPAPAPACPLRRTRDA